MRESMRLALRLVKVLRVDNEFIDLDNDSLELIASWFDVKMNKKMMVSRLEMLNLI